MKLEDNHENLQLIGQVIAYAFNKTEPVTAQNTFLSRYNHALSYGQLNQKEVTSYLMANDFKVQFYASQIKMGGIGYVASYPEYRGDGGISALMKEMLLDLYQEKYLISNLAPFSESFYRQFGYENTIFQKHYQISAESFSNFSSERLGKVKRGTWQDDEIQQAVLSIYSQVINNGFQVNVMCRANWWWERLEDYYPNRHFAIAYDEQNLAVGYLIYRMAGEDFLIDELVYQNGFAMRKLLTYVKSHVSSFKRFIYPADVAELVEFAFAERQGIEISSQNYMMSRIIDFQALIELVPFQADGRFVFEVFQDESCPWNSGKWQVEIHGNEVKCQRVANSEPCDLIGSIQAWAALLLGQLTIEQGILLAQFKQETSVDLRQLFPIKATKFYDYF